MTPVPRPAAAITPDRWTVQAVLDWTTGHLSRHGSDTPRLDAEILLSVARGCRRIELYTNFDQELTDQQRATMRDLVTRRAAAEPVAYLVGFREFFGLDFVVTPDVLIPRPDTETLVVALLDRASALTTAAGHPQRILDVGTGSGCIAVSVARQLPGALLTATDVSAEALQIARGNAASHEVDERITFLQGDLFDPLDPQDRFDFVASNPPYVRSDELAELGKHELGHEPAISLDGGPDGLAVVGRLVAGAAGRLVAGGWLLCEISPDQAEATGRLIEATGEFGPVEIANDLAGRARVVVARRTGSRTDPPGE